MLCRHGMQLYRRAATPCLTFCVKRQPSRGWKRRAEGDDLLPRYRGGRPLREVGPRLNRMADFIDRFENELFGGMESFFPVVTREGMRVAMDVTEDEEKYTVEADLPGMTKSDVKIQVTPDRVLTISGERQEERKEEKEGYYRSERRFGKFFRSFNLPKNADESKISAKAQEGVLQITIPKLEKEDVTARVIDIE